jgi:hypothetical protein
VKALIPLFLAFFLTNLALAQVGSDSVQSKTQSLLDSAQAKITSVKLPEMPDTLKMAWQRVDSVRDNFNQGVDSIKGAYDKSMNAITSQEQKIQHSIDSLEHLNLPSNKFIRKLDSLNNEKTKAVNAMNAKAAKLREKTIGQLKKIELTPEMQGPVNEFTGKINSFNISNPDLAKIPALQIPGYSLPKINGANGLSGLGLPKIETPLGDLGQVGKELKGLGSDVKNISQGNLNEVKQLPQTLEQQATKIDGISELQKENAVIDGYKKQLDAVKSEDALKQQAQAMVQKEAINHFAGKEKELQAAMNKMAKYKAKYASVSSLKDLPKRPPNAMKGKPFIERLVPGIYLQYQQKGDRLIDANPYLSYRISGIFTSGLGWNQRFAYNKHDHMWVKRTTIYGPRAFVDTKLGKGFIAHLEVEAMNVFVPFQPRKNVEFGNRDWVWSTMVGLKKEYVIYKNLHGTVLMQYNLINKYFRTPYVDRLNSRIGFEYMLHKKSKK